MGSLDLVEILKREHSMNPNCPDAETLARFVETILGRHKELDPAERDRIQKHIQTCTHCKQTLDEALDFLKKSKRERTTNSHSS
jgi:hypothetical protein